MDGWSGRFMSGLPDGRLEERRLGQLEDLAAAADVDADLGLRVDERRDEREPMPLRSVGENVPDVTSPSSTSAVS